MKLKLNDEGFAVVQDGKPVYVHDDGKEVPFDAAHTLATITRLNGEAKGHREAKEALEEKLQGFGDLNPEDARKALETVGNLSSGELKTAAQVEEIRKAAQKAAEEQVKDASKSLTEKLNAATRDRDKYQSELHGERIGNAFGKSKFIHEKSAMPAEMVSTIFGKQFKVEGGAIVGYDATGNKIYSRTTPGELAQFDEALELMVDAYPYRDNVLKGTGSSGSGSEHGRGSGGGKTMSRSEFNRLPPMRQREVVKSGTELVD